MEPRHRTCFFGLTLALLALAGFVGSAAAMGLQSWDVTIEKASKRFTVLTDFTNQAVLDQETGLVWEQSPGDIDEDGDVDVNDKLIWEDALGHCVNKAVGGRKGWRLPSIVELTSLVDPGRTLPALPTGHPFTNIGTGGVKYWSATTKAAAPDHAWVVSFASGFVTNDLKADDIRLVWCVRGGMNADAY